MKPTLADAYTTHDDAQNLVDKLVSTFSRSQATEEHQLVLRQALRSLEEAYLSLEAAKTTAERIKCELPSVSK